MLSLECSLVYIFIHSLIFLLKLISSTFCTLSSETHHQKEYRYVSFSSTIYSTDFYIFEFDLSNHASKQSILYYKMSVCSKRNFIMRTIRHIRSLRIKLFWSRQRSIVFCETQPACEGSVTLVKLKLHLFDLLWICCTTFCLVVDLLWICCTTFRFVVDLLCCCTTNQHQIE